MTTDKVTSPAGDVIEVRSDQDWIKLAGWPDSRSLNGYWKSSRRPVIAALWEHGAYEHPAGFAATKLYEDAQARGYRGTHAAFSQLLHKTLAPAIDRTTKAKRTYRVALTALPQSWLDRLTNGTQTATEAIEAAGYHDATDAIMELVDTPVEPEPDGDDYTDEPFHEPDVKLEVAQAVATSLLAQVIDIVSTGKPDTARLEALDAEASRLRGELDDVQRRLATALDYGQRTAREARQTADELSAVKHERDGLRQRLRQAEANLAKTLNPANQRALDEIVHREVDKVMRATPVHRAPDDSEQT